MAWFLCFVFLLVPQLTQLTLVRAVQIITPEIAPPDLSEPCLEALTANLTCGPMVPRFRFGYYYAESTLEAACTSECELDLVAYETDVLTACDGDVWSGYDDEGDAPLGLIPSLVRFQYGLTCLKDSGRWCNVVSGEAAYYYDPGDSPARFAPGSTDEEYTPPDPCDLCFVKSLRMQAAVDYYEGPALVSMSVYESKTDNCSIPDMPRTTSTLPMTLPTATPTTPTPCAGDEYEIEEGDDCHSISLSEGIGTGWLLMDNNLPAWCDSFPTEGTLCLVNKCDVVTVEEGDTCHSIAFAAEITDVQLHAWNLVLNAGCHNLDKLEGHQLCVSPPGVEIDDPEPSTTTTSTPIPIPTDVAEGTTERCAQYYTVQPDEYCNLLVLRFAISLSDFYFLNPGLNENCTNLFAFESYCVKPFGDINTYPGKPGHASTTTTMEELPFTSAIPSLTATAPEPLVTATGIDLAEGTWTDCVQYFSGADFQDEDAIDGTTWISQCQRVASLFEVSWEDLNEWNPSLANVTTSTECEFDEELRYCGMHVEVYDDERDPGREELPVREGAIEDCELFGDVIDGMSCADVLTAWALTIAQFYEYNPAVGSDCANLWTEMSYCMRGPGYTPPATTTTTAPPTSSTTAPPTPTPPAPTHPGQPSDCDEWHVIESGDTCSSVATEYSLTLPEFLDLNPAVSSDCVTNFWLGYAYCVGVAPVVVPSPVQTGNAHANCNAYAQAQSGDWCAAFADREEITLAELYEWNSVLEEDGAGCATSFWAGYWYCVGVSGD